MNTTYSRVALVLFSASVILLPMPTSAVGQRVLSPSVAAASQNTLLVGCQEREKVSRVFSPVWLSEDGNWRSFVEVDIENDGCLHTTRLWVDRNGAHYRLVYLIPPRRMLAENGMEILGWARHSSLLLLRTEE